MSEDLRDAFFGEVARLAERDSDVVIVTNDMDVYAIRQFKEKFPERFIDVGVAEQNLINVAAGLASTGKKVIVFGILSFLTTRCYEQIKLNICGMKLPVIIVGIGPGISFSVDGPTHHSTSDIGALRLIPELQIFNPSDSVTAKKSAQLSLNFDKPTLVRIDKGIFHQPFDCENGMVDGMVSHKSEIRNLIVYTGTVTKTVEEVYESLQATNSSWGILEVVQISPIPDSLIKILDQAINIIVIEENSQIGGLFSILAEDTVIRNRSINFSHICLSNNQIFEYGDRDWLSKKLRFSSFMPKLSH